MKQVIVLFAMISLGLIIFNMIAGDQDGSILTITKNIWESEIEHRQ